MLQISDVEQLNAQKLQVKADQISNAIAGRQSAVQPEMFHLMSLVASGQELTAEQKATFCSVWPTIKSIVDFLSEISTLFAFSKNWGPYITLLETFVGSFCATPIPPIPPIPAP